MELPNYKGSRERIAYRNMEALTFVPVLMAWSMTSMMVVVFPVPGGPWITATSGLHRANVTAFFWLRSRFGLMKEKSDNSSYSSEIVNVSVLMITPTKWWSFIMILSYIMCIRAIPKPLLCSCITLMKAWISGWNFGYWMSFWSWYWEKISSNPSRFLEPSLLNLFIRRIFWDHLQYQQYDLLNELFVT